MSLGVKTLRAFAAVFLLSFFSPVLSRASGIPDGYVKYPVMVSLDTGVSASGFYFNNDHGTIYFVTAGHVLFERGANGESGKPRAGHALLLSYPEENLGGPIFMELDLAKLLRQGAVKIHPTEDAVVVRIGTIESVGNDKKIVLTDGVLRKAPGNQQASGTLLGANARMTRKFQEVTIGNEIYLFGYPASLGIQDYPQIDYTRPLLRKGVVSGKNEEKKTLILDCTTHAGNSGGPVIEVEQSSLTETQFWIIGMVVEYIPVENSRYIGKKRSIKIGGVENSGYSVILPMDVILELTKDAVPAAPAAAKETR